MNSIAPVKNYNPALGTSFVLEIARIPEINYFIQSTELPQLTMPGVETSYQNNAVQLPSNRIDFEPFTAQIILDEELECYNSILKWLYKIRDRDCKVETELMSDVTLKLLTSNKTLNKKFVFRWAFPTLLGPLQLASNVSDSQVITFNVQFKFQWFDLLSEQ